MVDGMGSGQALSAMSRWQGEVNPQDERGQRCAACGRSFGRLDRRVRVAGLVVHHACGVYVRRDRRPDGS